ncbi:MAG: sialate O-acetylesterase [Ferruginibacter sp.]
MKNGEWQLEKEPLHFDKADVAGLVPGFAFGKILAEHDTNVFIGLSPCGVGGSSIHMWEPSQYYAPTKSYPYEDAIQRTRVAMRTGVLKGIIWHQGESDSDSLQSIVYEIKLVELVKKFRKDLKIKSLPFNAGTIGAFNVDTHPFAKRVNAAIEALPKKVKYAVVVHTEVLSHKRDVTHFNTASSRELGLRYATVVIHKFNKDKKSQ